MKLYKRLEAIMPKEYGHSMAYLGNNIETRRFCDYYSKMHDVEVVNLYGLPLKRWNFGSEFFEVLIIEDDAFLQNDDQIKLLKKALQREKKLIFISENLTSSDLQGKLEDFGFHHFRSAGTEPHISVASKWFAL